MSITIADTTCKNCGAPLEDRVDSLVCLYCDSIFRPRVDPGYRIPKARPELVPKGLFELAIGQTKYRVLGQLARGENSQVLLARRASATTEQVVIKLALGKKADQVLEQEFSTLKHLEGRNFYLDRLLPAPVELGAVKGKAALVYRWRSGFIHTFAFARSRYPKGVEPAATVWMWNRVLDQLTSLQDLGYSHTDLRPEHLLLHPRDHGVAFCGWGKARLGGGGDLAASGRCVAALLGRKAPKELLKLTAHAGQFATPQQLKAELRKISEALYGPPRFRSFTLS